ncbi:MAG: hypothetical protein Q9196_002898 [Gyalolechia fulgens]
MFDLSKQEIEKGNGDPYDGRVVDTEKTTDEKYGTTQRGLKSRHIQLIALGGCIGTGLFVGTGATLSTTGPAPLFMSFVVISSIVWVVMQCLGELSAYVPTQGSSVPIYVKRYVEPSLAFAAGWNYCYWSNPVPVAIWLTIVLGTIIMLNVIVVSWYGESEFWFASIKIIGIMGLIILGVVLFFGGGPNHDRLGFRYWQRPGAVSSGSATVFQWFVNLTTISGYIAWIILLITYLRFRRALEFNGMLDQRPYKSPLQPYATYYALSILVVLTLTNGFQVFFPGKFTASTFLAAYITLPIVIVLYLGHKIWFRTPLYLRVHSIDVYSGKEEADRLEELDMPPIPKNMLEKIWFWIA